MGREKKERRVSTRVCKFEAPERSEEVDSAELKRENVLTENMRRRRLSIMRGENREIAERDIFDR
jgi:hypothetical protein